MTTRTIVTSHPDLACDVCARRLLRGEQPDYFIADGRRRTVCELCAPRAAHEGWLRESDAAADVTLPPMRPRRGRSLLDRLLLLARPQGAGSASSRRRRPAPAGDRGDYDLFDQGPASGQGAPDAGAHEQAGSGSGADGPQHEQGREPTYLEVAVDAFNGSEYPRRIAGVARSLGSPVVSVRSAEHLDSIVRIVIAWELCWYRYEVDLGEEPVMAQSIGQGTELDQLAREEREGNAAASASGALALAP
jgi:hypothetical protein